ncbi:MAG: hypothetical protein LBP40_04370 [Campylobacteraceae bacterium]|jgi:hypothetical protein|nr:hypothetical protein [Campylobacteraceae bacterium]
MPNSDDYRQYRKSISDELMSIRSRVRNFVRNWAEDGRYKEIILKNVLERLLPKTVSVGTGFVVGDDSKTSSQIDIIVYLNSIPPLFLIDDFVVVVKESVVGIIEVKTKIRNDDFKNMMRKAHENGKLIGNHIFNGLFGYESTIENNPDNLPDTISDSLKEHKGYVNNITFGKNIFMKYWEINKPNEDFPYLHYSFYKLEKLAFGYFISNLIEHAYIKTTNSSIPKTLEKALYPIDRGGKEVCRIGNYEIEIK